jgi:CRISPR system Cascade subunit CasB
MTARLTQRAFYWEDPRFGLDANKGDRRPPPGDELAALRRGINHAPGTVPVMWKFYATWQADSTPWKLAAEHHTLTLFAVHQQSQSFFVHRRGVHVGEAIRALHSRFEAAAVDRRFFAAVTATEIDQVAYHLRGLLRQSHSLDTPTSFDYTGLFWDLARWGVPDLRSQVQRRWGLAYFGSATPEAMLATTATIEGEQ